MSVNTLQTAARHARRDRRFASDAACVRCGITTPETLREARRSFLEAHHVCGQAHDDALTVPVCRNCHAILTEGQYAAGMSFGTPPTLLHQIAAALTSLFAFLHELCERGMDWAQALSELSSELDANFPAWRDLPSATAVGVAS